MTRTKRSCIYCGAPIQRSRPHKHCTKQECVDRWLAERREAMSLDLVPKQGWTPIFRNQRDETSSGRSSGR